MVGLKIALLLAKNQFFHVKKGMIEFWRKVAQKHTTHRVVQGRTEGAGNASNPIFFRFGFS